MSNSSASFSFPARTPLFTTVVVLVCFAALGWLAMKCYVPQAYKVEGVRTPADRAALLAEHHAKEQAAAKSYSWVEQKTGHVRLPIERAIELTVREHAKP